MLNNTKIVPALRPVWVPRRYQTSCIKQLVLDATGQTCKVSRSSTGSSPPYTCHHEWITIETKLPIPDDVRDFIIETIKSEGWCGSHWSDYQGADPYAPNVHLQVEL